jgi:GNAT superfamily N-acetyltransferase
VAEPLIPPEAVVRPAEPGDLDALIALRQENGRVHEALDPSIYRVPQAHAVRIHFERVLAEPDPRSVVLVLADGPTLLGMAEVALSEPPPDHQVLLPTPTARLHVVVAPGARGRGVGTALERAAAEWAKSQGARELIAGIQADNRPAQSFYGWAGYRDQAVVMVRDLGDQ